MDLINTIGEQIGQALTGYILWNQTKWAFVARGYWEKYCWEKKKIQPSTSSDASSSPSQGTLWINGGHTLGLVYVLRSHKFKKFAGGQSLASPVKAAVAVS